DDLAAFERQNGDRHVAAVGSEHARHAHFLCDDSGAHQPLPSLISTATPAERSSFMRASTVCGVGSTMSRTRLWVRISNCSRDFLSTWGERLTVNFSMRVGSGTGPRTWAPVRLAVETISRADMSSARWSKALSLIRIFCCAIGPPKQRESSQTRDTSPAGRRTR